MHSLLAADWKPPAAYPALIERLDDGRFVLTFPDFQSAVALGRPEDALAHGGATVRRWLRSRLSEGRLMPFASAADSVSGAILMVPTEGWDRMEEEINPDD